jgi:hypothetical protein
VNEAMIKLVELLEKAGIAISEGAVEGIAYIYPLAVRERFITGVWQSVLLFLALIVLTVSIYFALKIFRNEGPVDLGMGLLVLSVALLLIFIITVDGAIKNLFSPEMAAIEKLLSIISGI